MKKTFITLACAAMFCACNAQHSLTVKLPAASNDTVTVAIVDKGMRSIEKTETVIAQNGVATYDFTGDKARAAMVSYKTADGPGRMQAYLIPGEQGTLTLNKDGGIWSGTKFYTELAQLEQKTDPIQAQMAVIGEEFQQKVQAGAKQEDVQKELMPKYEVLAKQMTDETAAFIKANPNSGVSLVQVMGMEDKEAAFASISDEVKKGVFSDIADGIQASIDKEKARKEAAKAVADGCVAPDFTLNDINGKPLKLSSLRGKYLILDFWGSWCGWCIKGFPEMKNYYKKYAGKFEILGVDCNDTEQKWKDAVKKHELPWKHVFNPKDSKVLTTYAVQGFPTKIVIDPQGKIVKTIVGEDPAFYTFLDELLK